MDDYLNIKRRTAKPLDVAQEWHRFATATDANCHVVLETTENENNICDYRTIILWRQWDISFGVPNTGRFVSDGAPRLIALRLKKYRIAVISRKRVETNARLHLQNFSERLKHDVNVDCAQLTTIPVYRFWRTNKFYVISEHNSCNNQIRQDFPGMSSERLSCRSHRRSTYVHHKMSTGL